MSQRLEGTEQMASGEQRWRERVEAWRRSGQSQRGFCRSQGISESKLSYWKKELERREAGRSDPDAGEGLSVAAAQGLQWIAVSWPSSAASEPAVSAPPQLELVLPRGWVIRLGRQFEGESLRRLLGVLEGSRC